METIAVTINLPTSGLSHDYMDALSQAIIEQQAAGNMLATAAIGGLFGLVGTAIAHSQSQTFKIS
jgi:hypothetical protein